jgi:enoyl-CoA hydratase/carnithine racemase
VGVITISRESYNSDVDTELNRAIDWLKAAKIQRVIITGDFHLSTQMVGADTSEFFNALGDREKGRKVSADWSQTARRLHEEFSVSVGFINGKRCLGGFLELLMHCHFLVSVDTAQVGMPEVTLPVIPGMEGCHWPFRKATPNQWPRLLTLLLGGGTVKASDAVGWLVDYAGTMDDSLKMTWKLATGQSNSVPLRKVADKPLTNIPLEVALPVAETPEGEAARKAILDTIRASAGVALNEALDVQSKHSADFMASSLCKHGRIGQEFNRVMVV